jgi:hypothetical protein
MVGGPQLQVSKIQKRRIYESCNIYGYPWYQIKHNIFK